MKLHIKNIQTYQTLFLSLILTLGINFYDFDISVLEIICTFTTVIFLDFLFLNFPREDKKAPYLFPHSWVNAGFWICFFLRSEDILIYIFAAILAIVGKHIIRIQGRHFFNPSNFWVFLSLILFPQFAWVNTLQWGNYTGDLTVKYVSILLLIISLWLFMGVQVYKNFKYIYILELTLPSLLTHSILFFTIPLHESWSSFFVFFNASFFIFTFFMITDPKTIPRTALWRILYSISLPFTFYVLQFFINESYALLGGLFFNTILLPVIWILEKKRKSIIIFYIFYYTFLVSTIGTCIFIYGQPDLVFNNTCNQLVCK